MITYQELRNRILDLLERREDHFRIRPEQLMGGVDFKNPDFDIDAFIGKLDDYLDRGAA